MCTYPCLPTVGPRLGGGDAVVLFSFFSVRLRAQPPTASHFHFATEMEGESELQEPQKRVAPTSTVSLDSTYDHDNEAAEKSPQHKRHSWTPLVVLAGLILVAVALVLALDRDDPSHQGIVVAEGDPFVSRHSAMMTGRSLTGPQHKLVAWLKQMQNASELVVDGGSSNASVSGLLFPRNDSGTWLPFDAVVTIESGVALPTRQSIVVHDGRGYKWAVTSLGYGDSIVTDGCLTSNRTASLIEVDEVLRTANWTSADPNDESEVTVVFGGRNYTISEEDGGYNYGYDSSETEDAPPCWSVESEEDDFGLRVCIPELWQELPRRTTSPSCSTPPTDVHNLHQTQPRRKLWYRCPCGSGMPATSRS